MALLIARQAKRVSKTAKAFAGNAAMTPAAITKTESAIWLLRRFILAHRTSSDPHGASSHLGASQLSDAMGDCKPQAKHGRVSKRPDDEYREEHYNAETSNTYQPDYQQQRRVITCKFRMGLFYPAQDNVRAQDPEDCKAEHHRCEENLR